MSAQTVLSHFSPDVKFDEDEDVMPLMSAAKVWWDLEHTVDDESLFKNIENLLLVQVNVTYFDFLFLVICFNVENAQQN